MEKFVTHIGTGVLIGLPNIDTDQIIPKQFLKRIERTGYGQFLFYDWRFTPDGEPIADFVLNDPIRRDASILIAGSNFGCGSSREHAPWSLLDHGFRVIIAPSFADIFYNNSFKSGLLPIVLPSELASALGELVERDPTHAITVDLENQKLFDEIGFSAGFEIDHFKKHCLLNGLDDIGLTLQHENRITRFELHRKIQYPFLRFE